MKTEAISLVIGILSLFIGARAIKLAGEATQAAADVAIHASAATYFGALAESAASAAARAAEAFRAVEVKASGLEAAPNTREPVVNDNPDINDELNGNSEPDISIRLHAIRAAASSALSPSEREAFRRMEQRLVMQSRRTAPRQTDPSSDSNATSDPSVGSSVTPICDAQCVRDRNELLQALLQAEQAAQSASSSADDTDKDLGQLIYAVSPGSTAAPQTNYKDAIDAYTHIVKHARMRAAEAATGANRVVYRVVLNADMAGTLSLGTPEDASLDSSEGIGLWTFSGTQGQAIRVQAHSTDFDPIVRIVSSAGEELARKDDSSATADSAAVAILPDTDTYLIQVMSLTGGNGHYSVKTEALPQRPLALGSLGKGQLSQSGDMGLWSFDGKKDQVVSVEARSRQFDTIVRLSTPTGKLLTWDDDGGATTNSLTFSALPGRGRYIVQVLAFGDGAGAYTVGVSAVQTLTLGKTTTAEMTESRGTTLWRLEGTEGQVIRVEARSEEFDTVVRLIAPTGTNSFRTMMAAPAPTLQRMLLCGAPEVTSFKSPHSTMVPGAIA